MSTAAAPPELHLPDLPEVSVTLGAVPPAGPPPPRQALWPRLLHLVSSYLPLLLMGLLALSTWWLVKNTPVASEPAAASAPRSEPDYTMHGFAITRFAADGQVRVRIEGEHMRHYPDTDRLEIDNVRIRALGRDGRITLASAQRALANGDATEVQLQGGARVQAQQPGQPDLQVQSEFLHAFLATEQLRTHLPVTVQRGSNSARAGGLQADLLNRQVNLGAPVRLSWGQKP
jgi:lipopolysaccharide export system protein LptC